MTVLIEASSKDKYSYTCVSVSVCVCGPCVQRWFLLEKTYNLLYSVPRIYSSLPSVNIPTGHCLS